ncbi:MULTISPECIES: nickel ABC transporter permease [Jonquetella]|uniref:ABC-type dipeptide/oligopeptide/nickel transport system, permease component n=1 Tax=Jonquetella anthropi DSM 22815 TaxID=885272 RepID=H0UKX4_9BACT|nr:MULTISPECIES: nickel ABC transporter permease [Jonquetella]EEX47891.1 ABC transporter, permease protein [Jonquetella anthropi E3_33 E1]EHM13333.1 ABC-type dipeptide/oligopeptide/nickel transport system, permease component [Jonquetella anthropi DSM 22815]ERL24874.1 ABC transporter, permease protein [Jonquetella sp. BV3C21]
MHRYIFKRLFSMVPVLVGVAFVIFTMLYLTPGDPAKLILGEQASEEALTQFRAAQGLNDPFFVQFGRYLYNAVFNQDIGTSYITKHAVLADVLSAFPNTCLLAGLATLFSVLIGIPLGIVSAIKQYSFLDSVVLVFALIGISMPSFWLGLLLILFFSVQLGWFPSSGFSTFSAMILPSLSLAFGSLAILTRMTRSSMLEVIRQDYIRTARAKGQKESRVIWSHALPNALIPIITVAGLQFGNLLGGALLTESIFSIPGVGRLMVDSIKMRDYPTVQGGVLFIAFSVSLVNLLVDLLYAYVDPRIKAQYK